MKASQRLRFLLIACVCSYVLVNFGITAKADDEIDGTISPHMRCPNVTFVVHPLQAAANPNFDDEEMARLAAWIDGVDLPEDVGIFVSHAFPRGTLLTTFPGPEGVESRLLSPQKAPYLIDQLVGQSRPINLWASCSIDGARRPARNWAATISKLTPDTIHISASTRIHLVPVLRGATSSTPVSIDQWRAAAPADRLLGIASDDGQFLVRKAGKELFSLDVTPLPGAAALGLDLGTERVLENVVFFRPDDIYPYGRGQGQSMATPLAFLWNEGSRMAPNSGRRLSYASRRAIIRGRNQLGFVPGNMLLSSGLNYVISDQLALHPNSPANRILARAAESYEAYSPSVVKGAVQLINDTGYGIQRGLWRQYQSSEQLRLAEDSQRYLEENPGSSIIRAAPAWYQMPVAAWPGMLYRSGFGIKSAVQAWYDE